ncbi:MAG: hypothetical protein IJY58_00685 [Alphaproteobacteria bacterium]|nr:hypothetical protein [Alphaproteobacteria bacterium]
MKKFLSIRCFLVLLTFCCVFLCGTQAYAGWEALGGKLFTKVLSLIGFGDGENGYCWFCPIFTALFNATNQLATHVANQLKDVTLATLGVGILFFIVFRVGATVTKLQEVDLMQFMGELFKHLGRAIVAAGIIFGTVQIFGLIVTPLLSYALNLGIEFMNAAPLVNNAQVSSVFKNAVGDIAGQATDICAAYKNIAGSDAGGMAFSNELLYSMKCMLATMSANLILGMVVGLCVIGMGLVSSWFLPDPPMILSGGVIFGAFFMIYLSVPFRLMENLVRLAFVAALMPFWVILWVFPATVQYTKNAWNMFLATCVSFIAFGVVFALIMQLLQYMLPNLKDVLQLLIPGYDKLAATQVSVFSSNVLLTFALGLFCKSLLGAPDEFAARISQSYGFNIGQGMEAQMASAAGKALGVAGGIGVLGGGISAFASGNFMNADDSAKKTKEDMGWRGDGLKNLVFGDSGPAQTPKQQSEGSPEPTRSPYETRDGREA